MPACRFPKYAVVYQSLDQAEADFQTNILAAKASLSVARTAARNAEIELAYCRMTAPISGRAGVAA